MVTRVSEEAILAALQEVSDPEIPPLSIVDMGMVNSVHVDGQQVTVKLTSCFVGCPAVDIIRKNVENRLLEVDGIKEVQVEYHFDVPWTSERITPRGHEQLRSFGIAPPLKDNGCGGSLVILEEVPPCPFCGSSNTHMENMFGPTACRSIYYCDACRQPFEAIKTV